MEYRHKKVVVMAVRTIPLTRANSIPVCHGSTRGLQNSNLNSNSVHQNHQSIFTRLNFDAKSADNQRKNSGPSLN
jgi:hypothetical protein